MAKKSTVTTNQTRTGTTTTTPNVPSWISEPVQGAAGATGALQQQGPDPFAPTTTEGQQTVWDKGRAGFTGPDYSGSNDLLNSGSSVGARDVQGQSLLDGLDQYYTPFRDQVLNPVLNDYDEQAGIRSAAASAEAGRNKAFQGSRYGIEQGQLGGEILRGRAATEGGLLDKMFTEATNLSNLDTGRRQQADLSNQQADLTSSQANQQAEIARAQALAANAAGADEATRQNTKLQADIAAQEAEAINKQKQYPIEFQNQINGLLAGLNLPQYFGNTTDMSDTISGTTKTKNTQGIGDWFGDALTSAAASASKAAMASAGGGG